MILCSKQEFDQVYLDRADTSEFMKYVSMGVERELVNKLMENIQDHQLHVIKLGEPKTEDDPVRMMVAYRQELSDNILVPCERCKYNPGTPRAWCDPNVIEVYGWCRYFIDRLGGKGFCPFGEE